MLTAHQFLRLNDTSQIKFLTNNLSTLDELLVFIELIQMQNLIIDFDNVLRKSINIWTTRLTLTDEIEEEYSEYLDDEQLQELNLRKIRKDELLTTILGIGLRMKLIKSFSEKYDINISSKELLVLKKEKKITISTNILDNAEIKLSKDYERRLSYLECIPLATTRASFVALAA
jgi:hypothetical protein